MKVVRHIGLGSDVIWDEFETGVIETQRQQSFVSVASSQNPFSVDYPSQKLFGREVCHKSSIEDLLLVTDEMALQDSNLKFRMDQM